MGRSIAGAAYAGHTTGGFRPRAMHWRTVLLGGELITRSRSAQNEGAVRWLSFLTVSAFVRELGTDAQKISRLPPAQGKGRRFRHLQPEAGRMLELLEAANSPVL